MLHRITEATELPVCASIERGQEREPPRAAFRSPLPARHGRPFHVNPHGNAEKSPDGGGHHHCQTPSDGDPQRRTTERCSTEMAAKGAEGSQAHKRDTAAIAGDA